MKYTPKEARAFFDWFDKRDFDYVDESKENYMMEAFIRGYQIASCEDLPVVSNCQCDSRDWNPFRIEQRVLCGKCDKPIN